MKKINAINKCPIEEVSFEHQIGSYNVSIKVGTYYEFNNMVHSNQRHFHDCYELVIVLSGRGSFEDKGISKSLKAGDVYIAKPFTEHEVHVQPTDMMTIFYLFFSLSETSKSKSLIFEECVVDNFVSGHSSFLLNNTCLLAYIEFINHYAKGAYNKNDPWLIRTMSQFVLQCLDGLSHEKLTRPSQSQTQIIPTFEWILDYIDQNIETKISAASIALTIGLSKSTLYRLFTKNLGQTVHDYIKDRKVEMAKHYLSMGYTVTEVSGLVNLEGVSYFGRLFKKYTGMTPSNYQKNNPYTPLGTGRRLP